MLRVRMMIIRTKDNVSPYIASLTQSLFVRATECIRKSMFGEDFEIRISDSFHPVVSARASLLKMFLAGKSGYGLKLLAFAKIFRNQVVRLSLSLLRLYVNNGQHACNAHLYHSYGSFLIARGHFRR